MKLQEFRDRHERGEGLPKREQAEPLPLPIPLGGGPKAKDLVDALKARSVRLPTGPRMIAGRHYMLIDPSAASGEFTDARIKFGKHTGGTVSYISGYDPSYLTWILAQGLEGGFPQEFLDVVARYT